MAVSPLLTGLPGSETFDESVVNAGPVLIAGDVSLTGGTIKELSVLGLLAEDIVSLLNQGSGAGEVGYVASTGQVNYGGAAIGVASGGEGSTFTVTFNGNNGVSAAIAQAVMQHLTFRDTFDDPTADRTLLIEATDPLGISTDDDTTHPYFARGSNDPFGKLYSYYYAPSFGDVNGDGKIDAVVGDNVGTLFYFKNTGTAAVPVFEQQTGSANPFDAVDVGYASVPALGDFDGDGKIDLVAGDLYGMLRTYRNTGTATSPQFTDLGAQNPFNSRDVGDSSVPTVVDLDGDGKRDIVVGAGNGALYYFRNTSSGPGNLAFTAQTGPNDPFTGVTLHQADAPAFADLNNDGKFDLIVGSVQGGFDLYLNTGTAMQPAFTAASPNTLANLDPEQFVTPTFFDLNGDGKLDIIAGHVDSIATFLRSTAGKVQISITPEDDAPKTNPVTEITVTLEDQPVNGTLAAGTDPENDTLTFHAASAHTGGTVTINPDSGFYTFTPAANFHGDASFSYYVSDGTANSSAKQVTVKVSAVNDAPVIGSNGGKSSAAVSVAENGKAVTIVHATDVDGDTATYAISGGADAAKFAINSMTGALAFKVAPDFEHPSDAGANNSYLVNVRASDGHGGTDVQAVTVTVKDVKGFTVDGTKKGEAIDASHAHGGKVPGSEADTLSGKGGDDTIRGYAGGDTIAGGKGADDLYAGKDNDADIFVFKAPDSGHKAKAQDHVFDFVADTDLIDVSHLHVKWKDIALNDHDGGVAVAIDTHGSHKPDIVIQVEGVASLHKTDFLL